MLRTAKMKQLKFFGCLLALVACFVPIRGEIIYNFNGGDIYMNETYWKCDKIECPPETQICSVTKQKLKPNATQVECVNTCYSANNEVLKQAINYDSIGATEKITLKVTLNRNGAISSVSSIGENYNHVSNNDEPFDQEQLDIAMANVKRINAGVQENLSKIKEQITSNMETLKENLRGIFPWNL